MRRRATISLSILLLLTGVGRSGMAQSIAKPELFQKSQEAAMQALAYYGAYENPAEMQRVADIGYRIAQESSFKDFPFTFYLIDMPEPNAFALPGGQIFLTRGMLNLGLNDDMLAGLLGHEIGHVVLQHGTRMQRRATLLNVLSQALLAGVIIAASQSGGSNDSGPYPRDPYGRTGGSATGDLIQGTAAAGAIFSELLLRSHSRGFEDEADDEGQRLAAAAGFDPQGTRQLMDKMRTHMPQSKEYGYWRTHPFFEDRVQAAAVRQDLLKIQEPSSADLFRQRTQEVLLGFLATPKLDPDFIELVQDRALLAWPQGPAADEIRLAQVHRLRDEQAKKKPMSQAWRPVIAAYQRNLDEVRSLTPESPLVATLSTEVAELERGLESSYPQAVEILAGGIFETEFLEAFISNYPSSPQIPEVSLALGEAYARLGREEDAVGQFLRAWQEDPASEAGTRAMTGLRNVTPRLSSLGALEQLAVESEDVEIRDSATRRLDALAPTFEELANGADYLKRFPEGPHAGAVADRLDQLAEELYGELVLYQSVGDHVKGIERIQQILTHAPNSPAAERLREKIVLDG